MVVDDLDGVLLEQVEEVFADVFGVQLVHADVAADLLAVLFQDRLPEGGDQFAGHAAGGVDVGAVLRGLEAGTEDSAYPAAGFDDDGLAAFEPDGDGGEDAGGGGTVDADVGGEFGWLSG